MNIEILADKNFDPPLGLTGTDSIVALALRNKGYDMPTEQLQEFIMNDKVATAHYEKLSHACSTAMHPCDHQLHVMTCANRLLQHKAITIHPQYPTTKIAADIAANKVEMFIYAKRNSNMFLLAIPYMVERENGIPKNIGLLTVQGTIVCWTYDLKKLLQPVRTDSKTMFEVE